MHTKVVVSVSAALLCASLSALVIFFYKLEVQKAAYQSMRAEEAEQTARHAALTSLVSTFEKTKDARETLSSHFLTEGEVIELLSLIENLGRENGVLLSTDELVVEPVNARFEHLVATISVEGEYVSVLRILELLEHLPYEAQIEHVTLSQEAHVWRGVFDMRILKFKSI